MNIARLENSDPLDIDHVPEGATVVDMRTSAAFAQWHYPGAMHMPLEAAGPLMHAFRPGEVVVAYCGFGAKSAILAQALRRRGVIAYTFHGGTAALLAQTPGGADAAAASLGGLIDAD
jgi:thiamine biosynthesis protein ThiI